MQHDKSEALYQKACQYMPGGVNSPVRSFANTGLHPLFVDHAKGANLVDVDDNTYLDYIGSWGPMILGHAHPLLEQSMYEVIQNGNSFGLCAQDEVALAALMCEAYPGMDMVRMVNSGTEATMSAIRLARGVTGYDNIIKFEGCYHGHSDGLLVNAGSGALTFQTPTSPGVPHDIMKHTLVCTYNDLASVECCLQQHDYAVAAIIIEPVAANMGVIAGDPAFLQGLRRLCDEHHILLIFDEVISGFRLSYGGAATYYGIQPDLACFGKIIGGGMPVGAYGGKRKWMEQISPAGPIYQAGTLSGNPLAMHVGVTLLTYLKEHPHVYTELQQKGSYLKKGIQAILDEQSLSYQIHQVESLLTLFFTDKAIQSYADVMTCDLEKFKRFFAYMYEHQILLAPSPYEAMFLSTAHTWEMLNKTLETMRQAFLHI